MIGHIYIIRNLVNGKVYIGQTRQALRERWNQHVRRMGSRNERRMLIKRAIRKYGADNFTIDILEDCECGMLNDREFYYIQKFDALNPEKGYNHTCGGSSSGKPLKLSEDVRDKMVRSYEMGLSLREVARQFGVDRGTVRNELARRMVSLRPVRSYKFDTEDRKKMVKEAADFGRKYVIGKYHVSKSYLSQLLSGDRRI